MSRSPRAVRVVVSLTLAAGLVGGSAAPAGAATLGTTSSTGTTLAVTGFQGEWSPTSKIHKSAAALTTVGVDGVNITPNGKSVPAPSKDAQKQLHAANDDGLRGEILVGNYEEKTGDFSEVAAYKLLKSEHNIEVVVGQIVDAVDEQGWDGVSVDLESLAVRDRPGLTRFVTVLAEALPDRATLSINVMWSGSSNGYLKAGYDLVEIAKVVDRVILMGYDQHGPWEDTPGPIGDLGWQKDGLEAMLAAVPPGQVDLGVAGYGYAWGPKSTFTVSDAKARKLVAKDHATAQFDDTVGEWTATLSDGTVMWWSDARSYKLRYTMASDYGLDGLAVWSLGLSDPIKPPNDQPTG